jgi:hypothetical protein
MMKLLSSGGSDSDWKEFLTPSDEEKMNEILNRLKKYRGAYKNSSDMKTAQLWAAILELTKTQENVNKRLSEIEDVFETAFERMWIKQKRSRDLHKSLETF